VPCKENGSRMDQNLWQGVFQQAEFIDDMILQPPRYTRVNLLLAGTISQNCAVLFLRFTSKF
jgi:hypothetical protein